MFKSTHNKGFQITFSNNITISVQWGKSNYCERKSLNNRSVLDDLNEYITESKDAEIAIWDKTGRWLNFGTDEVKGYLNADEVGKWITATCESETLDDIQKLVDVKI